MVVAGCTVLFCLTQALKDVRNHFDKLSSAVKMAREQSERRHSESAAKLQKEIDTVVDFLLHSFLTSFAPKVVD